jgi:hypothetical protein
MNNLSYRRGVIVSQKEFGRVIEDSGSISAQTVWGGCPSIRYTAKRLVGLENGFIMLYRVAGDQWVTYQEAVEALQGKDERMQFGESFVFYTYSRVFNDIIQ